MKITDKTKTQIVRFDAVFTGEVFKAIDDSDDAICLKLPQATYQRNDDEFCDEYNAYDFTHNEMTFFSSDERVEKIVAEMILNKSFT